MDINTLTEFLGYCSIINVAMLLFTAFMLVGLRKWIVPIHSKLLKLDETELNKAYLNFLSRYKALVIVFNIVPYIALKLM